MRSAPGLAVPRWALTGLGICIGGLILLALVEVLALPRPEALAERESRHAQVMRSAEMLRNSALASQHEAPGPLRDHFLLRVQRSHRDLVQALQSLPWAGPDLRALGEAVADLPRNPGAARRVAALAGRLHDEDEARLAERREEVRSARFAALWARVAFLIVMVLVGVQALRMFEARRREVQDLQSELDALMELLDHTRDFAGLARADGTILFWNAALRGLHDLGSSSSGRHRLPALAIADNHTPESYENLIHHGIPAAFAQGRWIGESTFVDGHGRPVPVRQVLVGIRDAEGRPTHLAMVATDQRELQSLARMRRALVQTVGHDLRSPLTSLRGALGAFRSKHLEGLGDEAQRLLRLADQSAERLARFVNDLLDLQKLEAGEVRYHRVPMAGEALTASLVRDLGRDLELHGLRLEARGTAPRASLLLDPDWMLRALATLASDTASWVPEGGTLVIHQGLLLGETGRPRGFRLETEAAPAAGGPRAKPPAAPEEREPGLPVQVALAVLRLHGGTVTNLPCGGFRVDLPLHHGLTSVQDTAAAPLASEGILLVQGDPGPALALRVALESQGSLTRLARNHAEILRILQHQVLDLVVVDTAWPGPGLLEVASALREDPRQAGAGLALMTREAGTEERPRGSLLPLLDVLPLAPSSELRIHRAAEQALRMGGGGLRPSMVLLEPQVHFGTEALALLEGAGDVSVAATAGRACGLLAEDDRDLLVVGPGGIQELGNVLRTQPQAVRALLVLADPGGLDLLPALAEAMQGLNPVDLADAIQRTAGTSDGFLG